MEVEDSFSEEKQSPENEGWEETKEEDIYTRLQKNFGPSIHCQINPEDDSFLMTVKEEHCILTDETLQNCLPTSSYQSLQFINEQSLHPQISKQYSEWESKLRKAFQENKDCNVPPEILQSILKSTTTTTNKEPDTSLRRSKRERKPVN
jgi:hypothetical protein